LIKTIYDWIFKKKHSKGLTVQEAAEKLYSRVMSNHNTLDSYQVTIEPFKILFLNRECSKIRPEEIGKYLKSLPVSEATRYLRFSHLKALFNVAIHEENISKKRNVKVWVNPCNALSVDFRKPKSRENPLEEDIDQKMNNVKGRLKENYRLIFDLGTRGGLRVSEICNLKPTDLLQKNSACLICIDAPKSGANQDLAAIPVDLYKDIKKYIREKKIKGPQRIFRISRQALWSYLKRKGIKPRDLRHYAAYRWIKSGKCLQVIQGMLRHRSIETTDLFLKNLSIHEK
jgi:integrase